jgi:hypothetical protein
MSALTSLVLRHVARDGAVKCKYASIVVAGVFFDPFNLANETDMLGAYSPRRWRKECLAGFIARELACEVTWVEEEGVNALVCSAHDVLPCVPTPTFSAATR